MLRWHACCNLKAKRPNDSVWQELAECIGRALPSTHFALLSNTSDGAHFGRDPCAANVFIRKCPRHGATCTQAEEVNRFTDAHRHLYSPLK